MYTHLCNFITHFFWHCLLFLPLYLLPYFKSHFYWVCNSRSIVVFSQHIVAIILLSLITYYSPGFNYILHVTMSTSVVLVYEFVVSCLFSWVWFKACLLMCLANFVMRSYLLLICGSPIISTWGGFLSEVDWNRPPARNTSAHSEKSHRRLLCQSSYVANAVTSGQHCSFCPRVQAISLSLALPTVLAFGFSGLALCLHDFVLYFSGTACDGHSFSLAF